MKATKTPRVWIGSLGAYNAGKLIGQSLERLIFADEVAETRSTSQHDLVSSFVAQSLLDLLLNLAIAELGALIEEHGAAFVAYAEHVGAEYATADSFEEAFCGEHDSERAYAEKLADGLGTEIPDSWPCSHIDWDSAANELFMSDYYSVSSPAGVYVFRRI